MSTEISGHLLHSRRNLKICRKATCFGSNSASLRWRLWSSHYSFLVNICQSIQRYINSLSLSFRALIIFEYIESNARTKSRTNMLTHCFSILYISGPGYNAWLSHGTFTIRSTPSSFGFGLFPTYRKARLSGKSLFLIQMKARAKLRV